MTDIRGIKFAAHQQSTFLSTYDSKNDVVMEAVAIIRKLADGIEELEGQVEEQKILIKSYQTDGKAILLDQRKEIEQLEAQVEAVRGLPDKWEQEYHHAYMGDDDYKHGRKVALHQCANGLRAALENKE